jgi:hypothetical protein
VDRHYFDGIMLMPIRFDADLDPDYDFYPQVLHMLENQENADPQH